MLRKGLETYQIREEFYGEDEALLYRKNIRTMYNYEQALQFVMDVAKFEKASLIYMDEYLRGNWHDFREINRQ